MLEQSNGELPRKPTRMVDLKAKLDGSRLRSFESAQRLWFADIPSGVSLDTILQPYYWAHHARTLQPDDMIRARCEDGSWAADLWVMFIAPGEVRLAVYHYKELDAPVEDEGKSDLYEIKWHGPGAKFAIVNLVTRAVIKDRLYPKSDALAYLHKHLRQVAKS